MCWRRPPQDMNPYLLLRRTEQWWSIRRGSLRACVAVQGHVISLLEVRSDEDSDGDVPRRTRSDAWDTSRWVLSKLRSDEQADLEWNIGAKGIVLICFCPSPSFSSLQREISYVFPFSKGPRSFLLSLMTSSESCRVLWSIVCPLLHTMYCWFYSRWHRSLWFRETQSSRVLSTWMTFIAFRSFRTVERSVCFSSSNFASFPEGIFWPKPRPSSCPCMSAAISAVRRPRLGYLTMWLDHVAIPSSVFLLLCSWRRSSSCTLLLFDRQ